MKLRLIENPVLCPACNTRMVGLPLHDRQCNCCGMPCYRMTGETKRTGEQMRLQRSWDAVLTEIEPREPGGGVW